MSQSKSIVGTWRLRTYEVWTAGGQVSSPLGESPVGFAVFDATGHAFIQLAQGIGSQSGALNSEVARETLASSFTAYFGTYTVTADGAKLSIKVQGSNRAAYVGSTQERAISIAEDTLTMGQPDQYRAILNRQQ